MNPLFTTSHPAPLPPLPTLPLRHNSPSLSLSCTAHIEMVRTHGASFSPREPLVAVLWDLDNKPPRSPPHQSALALRRAAQLFGRVLHISAYANRHAFLHLPQWVLQSRREKRHLDLMERRRIPLLPLKPYTCPLCGRNCPTNSHLKKHFVQIHERERSKKVSRMRSLKGKKRERYRNRFVDGNVKYVEAAREILTPKKGYGLDSELRRAGVFVRMVEDKPQAADSAVKEQMRRSMSRGIDCLVLVSDDSDFADMIRKAREEGLRTVVVGDGRRALGRFADFWIPWMRVEKGEVGEEVLLSGRNSEFGEGDEDESFYSSAVFYDDDDDDDDDDDGDLDQLVDEIIGERSGFGVSAFSEEEMWDGMDVLGASVEDRRLSYDIDDENDCYI